MPPLARAGILAVALAALAGCSSSDTDPMPSGCTAGRAADGSFTLALGDTCMKSVRLRVRSGGAFRAASEGDAIRIEDAGGGAVRVVASAPAPVEAFEITIPGVAGDAMLQQGYQSWSFSGAVSIPSVVPLASDGGIQLAAVREGNVLLETRGISYGSAVVGREGGPFLIAGALAAQHATTGIAAARATSGEGADVTITYGALREPLAAGAGGDVESEPIYLATATDAGTGLASYAAAVKAALPAGAITPKRPPGGWYSWNELFDQVSLDDVTANAAVIADKLAPAGMPLVEIDDGWERAWGDWTANDRFPGGMEAAGAAITGKGLVAGVWMAPFLVDVTSDAGMSTDPALFVQAAGGGPFIHTPTGSARSYYVLDGTSAASMAIATDAIAKLKAAGFTYFKLDFLYAGAVPGVHSQPGATGNEALASGLALLRKAMGEDAIFNACGAPILPVLGVSDSLRVGSDTAFSGVNLQFSLVTYAARSLAARAHLAPIIWPDADQAQLRPPYPTDEARAAAVVAALAGPAYALGDDLTKLDPARLDLALDPEILDLAGAAAPATPDDLFAQPAADVIKNPLLDSGSVGMAPPPALWRVQGKSGATYTVTFAWDPPRGATIAKQP